MPALAVLAVTSGLSLVAYLRWQDNWAVVIVSPIIVTLAFIYFEQRLAALTPHVRSELDEKELRRHEEAWQLDAGRTDVDIGRLRIHDLHVVAGPRKAAGLRRSLHFRRVDEREVDQPLLLASYRQHWRQLRGRQVERLARAASLLGVPEGEREAFIEARALTNELAVDIRGIEFRDDRSIAFAWAPCWSYEFFFLSNMLERPAPSERVVASPGPTPAVLQAGPDVALATADLEHGRTGPRSLRDELASDHAVRSILDVGAPSAPCKAGSVTVVVSEPDQCIIGMERLAVTHAYMERFTDAERDTKLPLHFVGEAVTPEDLTAVPMDHANPVVNTAYRAVDEELAISRADVDVIPTGVLFDVKRWQPVFTFLAFTRLSVAEVAASVKTAEDGFETGQIVALGWRDRDVRLVGRILADQHPTVKLASNHAQGALALALMYRDGAYELDGLLWREVR